jgi:hypothetical protein
MFASLMFVPSELWFFLTYELCLLTSSFHLLSLNAANPFLVVLYSSNRIRFSNSTTTSISRRWPERMAVRITDWKPTQNGLRMALIDFKIQRLSSKSQALLRRMLNIKMNRSLGVARHMRLKNNGDMAVKKRLL